MKNYLNNIWNSLKSIPMGRGIRNSTGGYGQGYDTLPPERIAQAARHPFVRDMLIRFSLDEYERNPYYVNVVEHLVNYRVGPCPTILSNSHKISDEHNDFVDSTYLTWCSDNGIGQAYRELVRQYTLTGMGIGIPHKNLNTMNVVPTSFKVYGFNCLATPEDAQPEDRIIHGIGYDKNWEPETFHLIDDDVNDLTRYNQLHYGRETKEYSVSEVLYWARNKKNGILWPVPECMSAFTFYPYIRRFIQAVLESEEFNASFPMAVELDPNVYQYYSQQLRDEMPRGMFEYQPRMVPTLKPGMKLTGIPSSVKAGDRTETMQSFASTCALAVQMPKNLAIGFTSNNMASSQMDVQPWGTKIESDRFDLEPTWRKGFKFWWDLSVRREMPPAVQKHHLSMIPHTYGYSDIFEHFDPKKRADARSVDLAAGTETLSRLYARKGLNFRREMTKEAKTLGISYDEMINIILASRSKGAIEMMLGPETYDDEE